MIQDSCSDRKGGRAGTYNRGYAIQSVDGPCDQHRLGHASDHIHNEPLNVTPLRYASKSRPNTPLSEEMTVEGIGNDCQTVWQASLATQAACHYEKS